MKITFVNGDRAGDELEYSLPEITIGREDGNIFRIPVPGVSRYHAKIWRNDSGQWMICDQGSTNGVKVNKKRINSTVVITENDEIEIGKQILRVSGLEAEMPKVIFNPIPGASAAIPDLPESSTPDFAPGTARPVSPVQIMLQHILVRQQMQNPLRHLPSISQRPQIPCLQLPLFLHFPSDHLIHSGIELARFFSRPIRPRQQQP